MSTPALSPYKQTTNRQWRCAVSADATGTPTMTRVKGISAFNPGITNTMADTTDYDSGMQTTQDVQSQTFAPTATVRRKKNLEDKHDPGQEIVRLAAISRQPIYIQYWNAAAPETEAYEGWSIPNWTQAGGAASAWQEASITFAPASEHRPMETNPEAPAGG